MNCQEVRQKISDGLAAGATQFPGEVAVHQESCPACRDFYQAQSQLFRSLDAGLQVITNRPVPPALLATVRARIQDAAPRRVWIHRWLPAGAAVVLLCVVALPVLRRAEHRRAFSVASSPDQKVSAPVTGGEIQAAVRPDLSTAARVAHVAGAGRPAPRTASTSTRMEVIFDKEEARGLSRLVRSIDQKPALAQGFLKAAPLPPDETKPAAPIEIAGLSVAPLTDENR